MLHDWKDRISGLENFKPCNFSNVKDFTQTGLLRRGALKYLESSSDRRYGVEQARFYLAFAICDIIAKITSRRNLLSL
jgi:hypothetical protein